MNNQTQKNLLLEGRRLLINIVSILVSALVLLLRPLEMTFRQSGILAATLLIIIWWSAKSVPRTWASIVLILIYVLFSGAPLKQIFSFPLSSNFILIIISFLFSQGISNSGLVDKLVGPLLLRYARGPFRLMGIMLLLAFAMSFVIPQPFSRIILLGLIFSNFFGRLHFEETQSSVWMLALFIISVIMNMSMIRGDIILNNTLLGMTGLALSESLWLAYLFLPTMVYLLLALTLYWVINRKTIANTIFSQQPKSTSKLVMSGQEKRYLVFILLVITAWGLESFHGIPGLYIVIAASFIMFLSGLLKPSDLSSVNVPLLVFLTAAFAIGGTLNSCGVADLLFTAFANIFPTNFSPLYVLMLLLSTILLHMVLGSNITTMSVVVPGMMSIGAGVVPDTILGCLTLIAVCGHFVLPFHHVILLLGEGKGYYNTRLLLRFGLPLTILTIVCVFLLYLPWWNILGISIFS